VSIDVSVRAQHQRREERRLGGRGEDVRTSAAVLRFCVAIERGSDDRDTARLTA
jgi:hypothetical protein